METTAVNKILLPLALAIGFAIVTSCGDDNSAVKAKEAELAALKAQIAAGNNTGNKTVTQTTLATVTVNTTATASNTNTVTTSNTGTTSNTSTTRI